MTTEINPEADPTYLAYQRARQYNDTTLRERQPVDQGRLQTDYERAQVPLQAEQTNSLENSANNYRAAGFSRSGLQARDADRIRADIAFRLGTNAIDFQRGTQDLGYNLAQALAQSQNEQYEQELAARARLTSLNAQSGVGL